MDILQKSARENGQSFYSAAHDMLAADPMESHVLSHEKINYHVIDLGEADWRAIRPVIDECGRVECACWTPQEKFSDYLKKCDFLSYAELDGRIIGFTAMSLMFFRNICLYSNDETMVLKEFRKNRLALGLVMLPMEWIFSRTGRMAGTPHIVYTSISANPKVVSFYFKNAWTRLLFDCSFKPSMDLVAIKNEYCRKHGIELVHEDYPFFLKNLFPGSNLFDRDDPRFQFIDQVKGSIPPSFDHMDRGDAYAFMFKIPTKALRAVSFILMSRCFGRDYLAGREISPFWSSRRPARPRAGERRGAPGKALLRQGYGGQASPVAEGR